MKYQVVRRENGNYVPLHNAITFEHLESAHKLIADLQKKYPDCEYRVLLISEEAKPPIYMYDPISKAKYQCNDDNDCIWQTAYNHFKTHGPCAVLQVVNEDDLVIIHARRIRAIIANAYEDSLDAYDDAL